MWRVWASERLGRRRNFPLPPLAGRALRDDLVCRFRRLLRAVNLLGAPAAASGPDAPLAALPTDPDALLEALVRLLLDDLDAVERASENRILRELESWRDAAGVGLQGAPGTLAPHGGLRVLGRAALRIMRGGTDFFDITRADPQDRGIIDHLRLTAQPRTLTIAGHTHGARFLPQNAGGCYLNTGTWSPMIRLPDSVTNLQEWIDALESGRVETLQRFTFAEIDPAGARLMAWTDPDLRLLHAHPAPAHPAPAHPAR